MRKLFFMMLTIVLSSAMVAQAPATTANPPTTAVNGPVITFEKLLHDFGKIKEQDGTVTYSFKFTNTGNAPLVINRVHASCGCTTPTWTREPIMPGKTGTITAAYNPLNRPNAFLKTISVFTNADTKATVLSIKGDVIPRPAVSQ